MDGADGAAGRLGRAAGMVTFAPGRLLVHRHFTHKDLVWIPLVRVVSDDERGLLLWMPHGTPMRREVTLDGRGPRGMPFDDSLEVGWRLVRHGWGHGYATEAARAALEVGLEQVDSVVSFTAVVNERSWRVMERLGMRRESEFDHPRVPDGSPLKRHYLYRTP